MNKDRQLDDFFGTPSPGKNGDKNSPATKKHASLKEIFEKKNNNLQAKAWLLPKALSKKERYFIFNLLLIIICSIVSIPIVTYYHFTKPVAAYGGMIKEGIVGEPRHINPLLSQSDADRDLVKLIYSGLFKYNEDGKLVPDLAKSYETSPDELNYTIYLKEDVMWHDGTPITADDIIFTVQTAQNPDYGSLQRINWQGVELEKVNDQVVIFKLKNKYAQFLNNLTMPLLPQHLWENVKPINFALSELNIKPIGAGPYKFKKLKKNSSGRINIYELAANSYFNTGKPFIEKLELKFYGSEDALIEAYNKNEIDNLVVISPKNIKKIRFKQRLTVEKIKMPRYFGVFFNQNQSKILSDKNIRLALAHATDKESIIGIVLENNGIVRDAPIMDTVLESDRETKKYEYNRNLAKEIFQKAGWLASPASPRPASSTKQGKRVEAGPKPTAERGNKIDENEILMKGDEKLSLKLTTSTWPELAEVAQQLKEQWKEVGVDLQIEVLPTSNLQQIIKERNYQMLLFGEILNLDPDPFSLWHSSQKRDPGLNLALYDNKAADKLLEEARQTLNPDERRDKYNEFQKLVVEDLPALFLYSPYYLYAHSKKIMGFENHIISTPSDRLLNIEKWYVETKRVWR